MGDVLSQSEIDSLLRALSDGELDVDEMKDAPEKQVKNYDFARPSKFSKEHLRTLEMIFENYGRLISTNLPVYLRKSVQVEVMNSEAVIYSEFSNALSNPVLLGVVDMQPLSGNIIIEMASNLGYTMVDRMLGGVGQPLEKNRDFSEIELLIIERIMTVCVELLSDPWQNVVEIHPRLERIETNSQFAQIISPSQDTEEIIKAVTWLAPGFGGINLEDISAPRCFEIEERLNEILDIPVFHDDQHGTAIVVLAGIINALKVTGKRKEDCRVVVNGAGSAGIAITKLLLTYGFPKIILCDKVGILAKTTQGLNWMQQKMTQVTNLNGETGSLADALKGADIFVGVSAPNIVTPEMVASMNRDAILFAMANPVPEIMPDVAKAAGARVVGTGRSDFPNQVNNVVAFPGIFRGALEGRASRITEEMKLAAAEAIAGLVPRDELCEDNIMPEAFNPKVAELVAAAVKAHIR